MSVDCLNIVVPMAGRGSRFKSAGYDLPKPLLPVHGKPMIECVIENLRPKIPHRFFFIVQSDQVRAFQLGKLLQKAAPGCEIVELNGITEGAANTVLMLKDQINNSQPLMIANCDQYVACDINDYLSAMTRADYDGFIMTMTADHPKWSYLQFNNDHEICAVLEKQVVSDEATVGIYNYKHGADFVDAAETMIANNDRYNNEFYVAPAYNYMLKAGKKLGFWNIGSDRNGMYGLGVPEDLTYFNSLEELPK